MTRLAQLGLVHCDFNEFNLLVSTSVLPASEHKLFVRVSGGKAGRFGRPIAVKVILGHAQAGCSPTDSAAGGSASGAL